MSKQVVLIGGGHTHALVLHGLKAAPLTGARVTVINPGPTAPYSGMLPGFVAGHYSREELDINLNALCSRVGAGLVIGRAVAMEPEARSVILEDGQRLAYDLASVDVGITSRMGALPGFAAHAVPAKPLAEFAQAWEVYRDRAGAKSVAIIGGGIAGAELAMAMAYALRNDPHDVQVRLVDRSEILSANSVQAQRHVRRALAANRVEVVEHADVIQVTQDGLVLGGGAEIAAEFVVGAAGATPHGWLAQTGLRLHQGFVEVDAALQSSVRDVFAVGDCAHMAFDPRPKAGVYAVRQAPVLLENLRRALAGEALQSYAPQSDYLKLVSLGARRAFGEKRGWALSGRLMWRLKDKIDRDFMRQF